MTIIYDSMKRLDAVRRRRQASIARICYAEGADSRYITTKVLRPQLSSHEIAQRQRRLAQLGPLPQSGALLPVERP